MGRYINPFTDWGYKRLFGQEFSKDLLINFLNDLFDGEFQIKDVTFKVVPSIMLVRLLLPSARSLMKQVSVLQFYISLCRFMWFAS